MHQGQRYGVWSWPLALSCPVLPVVLVLGPLFHPQRYCFLDGQYLGRYCRKVVLLALTVAGGFLLALYTSWCCGFKARPGTVQRKTLGGILRPDCFFLFFFLLAIRLVNCHGPLFVFDPAIVVTLCCPLEDRNALGSTACPPSTQWILASISNDAVTAKTVVHLT